MERATWRTALAQRKHSGFFLIFLSLLLIGIIFVSVMMGRYSIPASDLLRCFSDLLANRIHSGDMTANVVLNIRMPRIFAAVLVGAALAAAGASYQGIFRNPMVSPDILGATAGASFGASLAIIFSFPPAGIQIMSFLSGILAVMTSYLISSVVGRRENITLVLVLSGMVVTSLFSAFISIIKYTADPLNKLPEITYWLMGSLSNMSMGMLLTVLPSITVGFVVILLVKWRINVLAFGDEEAKSLGVNAKALRGVVIVSATLITASAVSISGQIGWIGLVIPHMTRMLTGPDYRKVIPASMLIGGIFLLIVDNISRNLLQVEIPLGILTAVIGAPFFIYLLFRGKRGWI